KLRKLTNVKSQIVFAVESTAHYWLALYTRLRKDGYKAIVLNPIQTSAMREMSIRKTKTDSKDSFLIAELIRFGRYAQSNVAQDKLLALKELCRNRYYLVDMASDLKRKAIALIDRIFPEYETQFETIFCKSSIAVLKKYPTPKKLAHANLSKLTEILLDSSNGRFGEWKAQELKSLARDSFGVEDCEDIYSMLLLTMLDEIQSLTEKADELEKRISSLLKEFDSTITSVPGIGPILGACILSEIGDVTRFRSADKLTAYIGVDPSVNQSGEYISDHAHMSKRGSPYLRRAVWMASIVAVQRDPMFRAYYDKKAAQGLKYMNIIGHVTKKMTAVIFAVLRDNKIYAPVLPDVS
ncbi:IS110 family transposase, partial [Oscillospiraceae bacterium 21-37]